jgi:hypothetical protein
MSSKTATKFAGVVGRGARDGCGKVFVFSLITGIYPQKRQTIKTLYVFKRNTGFAELSTRRSRTVFKKSPVDKGVPRIFITIIKLNVKVLRAYLLVHQDVNQSRIRAQYGVIDYEYTCRSIRSYERRTGCKSA